MHLLFTQVHFLFSQPGWVVGQYTTVDMLLKPRNLTQNNFLSISFKTVYPIYILLYILNIDWYFTFLTNTLDTMVKEENMLSWRLLSRGYLTWVPRNLIIHFTRQPSSSFRGPSSQVPTLRGGTRFIAWHLRQPF